MYNWFWLYYLAICINCTTTLTDVSTAKSYLTFIFLRKKRVCMLFSSTVITTHTPTWLHMSCDVFVTWVVLSGCLANSVNNFFPFLKFVAHLLLWMCTYSFCICGTWHADIIIHPGLYCFQPWADHLNAAWDYICKCQLYPNLNLSKNSIFTPYGQK